MGPCVAPNKLPTSNPNFVCTYKVNEPILVQNETIRQADVNQEIAKNSKNKNTH